MKRARSLGIVAAATLSAFLQLATPASVWAVEPSFSGLQNNVVVSPEDVPSTPSAPMQLHQTAPTERLFHCDRYFTYQGKQLSCDAALRADAEGLRPILRDVPAAIAELDTYQNIRRRARISAYVGSSGFAIALASLILARTNKDSSAAANIRLIGVSTGVEILLGTLIYSIFVLHDNESHLGNAVDYYNAAKPNDPVQLQFNTGFSF